MSADDAKLVMIRRGLGLTQEELADMLGVARRTIARWEDGTTPIKPGVWLDLRAVEDLHRQHVLTGVPAGEDWPVGWRESVAWAQRSAT